MKVGEIVLVHENTVRVNWKLDMIESVNKGGDGMVPSANIRTATGRTNRPISCLYPLEVTAPETIAKPSATEAPQTNNDDKPFQGAREFAISKHTIKQMRRYFYMYCGFSSYNSLLIRTGVVT